MSEIKFSHTVVQYTAPVVFLIFKEGAELDVAETRELIRAAEKLAGGKPYLLFSDARGNLSITAEARKVAADIKEAPLLVANAVLVNNLGISITANFFMKFNKPHFQIKVFNDREKALEWLLKFELKK